MQVDGTPMRTIWLEPDGAVGRIIDQTRLPHELVTIELKSLDDAATPSAPCWCAARR
jgi:methylthioribose-1-phosphate isomerase